MKQPERLANLIVDDIILQEFETKNGKMALSKTRNVSQSLNRGRAKTRANHPKDLNFKLNLELSLLTSKLLNSLLEKESVAFAISSCIHPNN